MLDILLAIGAIVAICLGLYALTGWVLFRS
mgnify:CR=1 FL=1